MRGASQYYHYNEIRKTDFHGKEKMKSEHGEISDQDCLLLQEIRGENLFLINEQYLTGAIVTILYFLFRIKKETITIS